jgi:hypothetical protein
MLLFYKLLAKVRLFSLSLHKENAKNDIPMKTLKTSVAVLLTLMTIACNSNQPKPTEQTTTLQGSVETGIQALRDYTLQDTITIGGRLYNYTCTLAHDETLPSIINPQGAEYYESQVCIAIRRDSTDVFKKVFHKNNLREYVPAQFLKNSTMVGVNYNFNKRDEDRSAFYFIITVGDPDVTSDMVYPLELKVATDGSYSLKKAENLETGPLSDGLTVEPREDAI